MHALLQQPGEWSAGELFLRIRVVEREITIPADASLKPVKYTLTLTAKGSPRTASATTKFTVAPEPVSIDAGGWHACAVLASGHIVCWGEGGQGEPGNGSRRNENTPVEVKGIGNAAQVSSGGGLRAPCWRPAMSTAGGSTSSARPATKSVRKSARSPGVTNRVLRQDPVRSQGIGEAIQISAGEGFSGSNACAVLASGHVDCWGEDDFGQLGNGTYNSNGVSTPVEVQGVSNASQVSAGKGYTCSLLSTGHVDCWGDSDYEGLDSGDTEDSAIPAEVQGITDATAISVGAEETCALLATGDVECWGFTCTASSGMAHRPVRKAASQTAAKSRAARSRSRYRASPTPSRSPLAAHTCARCLPPARSIAGANSYAGLGLGTDEGPETCDGTPCSTRPVEPKGVTGVVEVSPSTENACVLLAVGARRLLGSGLERPTRERHDPRTAAVRHEPGGGRSTRPVTQRGGG